MALTRTERISHYAVVIIATTAVAVSVWQGRISEQQTELMRQHNRLTVMPHLGLNKHLDNSEGLLEIRLTNEGYGPAIVRSFIMMHGDSVHGSWNEVLGAAGEARGIRYLSNYSEGRVIAPGTEDTLVRLETENTVKGVTLRIEYESIYADGGTVEIVF